MILQKEQLGHTVAILNVAPMKNASLIDQQNDKNACEINMGLNLPPKFDR